MVLLSRLSGIRNVSLYVRFPISVFPLSTLSAPLDGVLEYAASVKPASNKLDESHVLEQLCLLLPIRHEPLNRSNLDEEKLEMMAVDGFLSPEEKLRGVFLQRLQGKFAIEHALKNVGVELTFDIIAKVVNRGSLDGEAMVAFFNWAVEQLSKSKEIDTYHIILKALGRRKFFTFMVQMLQDMKMRGVDPNSQTLLIIMDSFIRARQISKAIKMFTKLEEFGWTCDTESLNVLLLCLCRRSHVGAAILLLNKMKEKLGVNSVSYNAIISGWSRYGRVDEIEKTLKGMVADGIEPDSSTYSYVLEGLGRAGRIDSAVEVFKELEKEGRPVDVGVFNAMISNFVSVGDFDECLKYYELMMKNNCAPDLDTYIRLISGFLKARKVADAIEMFDEMLGRGIVPMTGTITTFIEPLCSYGPPHAALMIYQKARKVGCRISLSTYKLLFMRLSRFGKCGMLLNIWNEMYESGYSPDMEIYEHAINGLCNVGQLENAVLLMEECLGKGFYPSKLICSKLNNKLLTACKVEMAYKLLLKIKDARRNENAQKYWRAKGWHF